MSAGTAAVSLTDATVGYRRRRRPSMPVVDGVTVAADAGEVVAVLGANGAGKSTLLRTIAGTQRALAGTVAVAGHDVSTWSPRARAQVISTVLTDRIDVGVLPARDLVALGRHPYVAWHGRLDDDDHRIVDEAIAAVDAGHLLDRASDELSDGERQRLMLARALAQQPRLLILDEPTAFLDITARAELAALIRRLADHRDITVLWSTHELDLALRTADTAWLIAGAAGHPRRLTAGTPHHLRTDGHLEEVFGPAAAHL